MRRPSLFDRLRGKKEGIPKTFKEMTPAEKKERIVYLWKKVRLMVTMRESIKSKMLEI